MHRISLLTSSLLLISCSQLDTKDSSVKREYWPALPETPRYKHEATFYNTDDIEVKNENERLKEIFVGKAAAKYKLKRPLSIAVKKGVIYINDAESSIIHAFDMPRRRYFQFGFRFEGKLVKPIDIAVDSKGLVYVTDRALNAVVVYDKYGLYQKRFDLKGITTQLAGITTDAQGNFIYVVDRGGIDSENHQIIKLDKAGKVIKRIGKRGKKPGEFNLPMDAALGSNNILYVLDSGNFRIQAFDQQGNYLYSWGKAGNGFGLFGRPRSIATDQENNVYVSDAQFGNIQIFNAEGELLMHIGQLSNSKDKTGEYTLLTGINVDERNNLYALDQYINKLEIFKKLTESEQINIMDDYKHN